MKLRFFFLISSTTLALLFIVFHVYNLQVGNGDYYTRLAQAQNASSEFLLPRRGSIYITDRDGTATAVAIVKEYPALFAVPKEIIDPDLTAGQLQQIFPELEIAELVTKLSKPGDEYELIKKRLTDGQVEQVKSAEIKGVYFEGEKARLYPFKELASHVLGFVGLSQESDIPHGKYGIEAYYNSELTGKAGSHIDGELKPPVPGRDIMLTLDREIQARSQEILARLVEQYSAVGGSVLVQEPATGRLLALANYPTYDPNTYSAFPISRFVNAAIEGRYEPGSVFKILTMAIGLDTGAITPDTTYYDSGSFTANGKTIKNWDLKSHGTLTMTQVIEGSVNTGSVFAEQQIGNDVFYNYLVKFGFKEPTGITLPNEAIGSLNPLEQDPRDINFATASFGQGVATTPIRLITAVSAIANKGVMHKPYILEEERSDDSVRVISEKAATQVAEMMVSSVRKNILADIKNYDIAGKTGTAFVAGKGGYTDEVINTYVGFAPAYEPKFTILIKLDKPADKRLLAGRTVVPAFRELAEFLLNYYGIPPTALDPSVR